MTCSRTFGRDSEFGAWFRGNELLDSRKYSMTMTDVDFNVRCYEVKCGGYRTRDICLMMNIEIKFHGAMPKFPQSTHLFFMHQRLTLPHRLIKSGSKSAAATVSVKAPPRDGSTKSAGMVRLLHFGYSIVTHSGPSFSDADKLLWSRFTDEGLVTTATIDKPMLTELVGMRIDPDTFQPVALVRGHHGAYEKVTSEVMPLGFAVEVKTTVTY